MDETHRRSTTISPESTITDLSQDYRDYYSIQNDKSHSASSTSLHPLGKLLCTHFVSVT